MIDVLYWDKGVKKAKFSEFKRPPRKPLWIDITDIKDDEAEALKKLFNLHPLTVEDIVVSNSRIKVEEFNNYLYCVFYGVDVSKNIEMIELDFIIGKNFIISHHKKEMGLFTELKNDKIRLERLFTKGPEFIFHRLLDRTIENFFPVLEKLDDQIERIEEEVIKYPTSYQLTKILKLKRSLVVVKRIGYQQREKISFLAKGAYKYISRKVLPYLRDIYDNAIRVSDSLDNHREAVGETFDAYMSAVNNSMNEVMKLLSVIATIALPMTVISGIYGMNFRNLPGSAFYYGFWVVLLVMFVFVLIMLYFFRKRGWF
ncbi:magnesium/cobalt transporter CorA [Candidatus Woesearchaeota archaeon]|nr:magnesium/cobalt transporter CorA [Candidatus Woesearchaeota archaeon]